MDNSSIIEETLKKIYFDPKNPASYSSIKNLFLAAKKEIKSIKLEDVKIWLKGNDTYTLHRLPRRNFSRNKVFSPSINYCWSTDLADMRSHSQENDAYNYLLCAIDVFSKVAYVYPLKTKRPEELITGFTKFFTEIKPEAIGSDKGGEYCSKSMEKFFTEHDVRHFTSQNEETKQSVCERFIRTLKGRIYRYLTANNTKRYIDVLPDIVNSYNNTFHTSIKMTPRQVNEENSAKVLKTLYGVSSKEEYFAQVQEPKLKTGTKVRLVKAKDAFYKGYYPVNTEEQFKVVSSISKKQNPVYKVKDELGEDIVGSFYKEELIEVKDDPNRVYRIEKVLKERKYKGKKQVLIRWLGHDERFDSWINKSELNNYK